MPDHPGLSTEALRKLLAANGVDVVGDLKIDLISGGRSNLTFAVEDGERRWIARRPPMGGLTPSAHDMNREWAVTSALADTNVPVAPTVAIDRDGEIIGAPCTVVEFVDGLVIRSTDDLNIWSDDEVTANFDALVKTLADLHAVDYEAVGLGDFGRPEGFAGRQVKLWARQWGLVKTRDLADVDTLVAKLSERIPTDARSTIVHGDFRVDNTIIDGEDSSNVKAVVDWEMAALGDPLTDVALMCIYRQPVFATVLGFRAAWTSDRYPSAADMAQAYATVTGADLGDWDFYLGLANLKLGVIAEGITHRALLGGSSGAEGAERAAEATAAFIAAGLNAVS
ncbi:MAG TPA: phosphotransferase family protein [Gordonia sp. (in: high G+C Gram-positive bacteria)]|uniref:phosphotransferase family protein n=1 Tax=unclassified Gordonia (in: high G+C Gram-positive bacteria) TaxID=2657482 RepID=UPI000FA4D2F0|nr:MULTISPECIES: phosphotransferase family protein [unclassified Gordonia (in: high G+C Gram-positive bacteria)]RUP36033.1 MAG: phosphotransferase family protein [Gordonia sp. (in: high G+C Gram-positive bacteria)]HNP57952.1 phosphotransferase family protein [Gordonia sp. (in: high G+C Gram-positive bacteria)]HRC49349.1 phosphotransferase family protein [Gordonia sp. (in: high G+C Gram-positive bacteria)]